MIFSTSYYDSIKGIFFIFNPFSLYFWKVKSRPSIIILDVQLCHMQGTIFSLEVVYFLLLHLKLMWWYTAIFLIFHIEKAKICLMKSSIITILYLSYYFSIKTIFIRSVLGHYFNPLMIILGIQLLYAKKLLIYFFWWLHFECSPICIHMHSCPWYVILKQLKFAQILSMSYYLYDIFFTFNPLYLYAFIRSRVGHYDNPFMIILDINYVICK